MADGEVLRATVEIGNKLVRLAPPALDKLKLTGAPEMPDFGVGLVGLFGPPPREERDLGPDVSLSTRRGGVCVWGGGVTRSESTVVVHMYSGVEWRM